MGRRLGLRIIGFLLVGGGLWALLLVPSDPPPSQVERYPTASLVAPSMAPQAVPLPAPAIDAAAPVPLYPDIAEGGDMEELPIDPPSAELRVVPESLPQDLGEHLDPDTMPTDDPSESPQDTGPYHDPNGPVLQDLATLAPSTVASGAHDYYVDPDGPLPQPIAPPEAPQDLGVWADPDAQE